MISTAFRGSRLNPPFVNASAGACRGRWIEALAVAIATSTVPHPVAMAAQIAPAGSKFTCTPIRVWDGDGPIWCAEGPKIRLSGIAAREIDGQCKTGHPCPKASGPAARDHLVRLLGGARGTARSGHVLVKAPTLRCRSEGSGKGSRTAARCRTPAGVDLSCAMVRGGYALPWARYGGHKICR